MSARSIHKAMWCHNKHTFASFPIMLLVVCCKQAAGVSIMISPCYFELPALSAGQEHVAELRLENHDRKPISTELKIVDVQRVGATLQPVDPCTAEIERLRSCRQWVVPEPQEDEITILQKDFTAINCRFDIPSDANGLYFAAVLARFLSIAPSPTEISYRFELVIPIAIEVKAPTDQEVASSHEWPPFIEPGEVEVLDVVDTGPFVGVHSSRHVRPEWQEAPDGKQVSCHHVLTFHAQTNKAIEIETNSVPAASSTGRWSSDVQPGYVEKGSDEIELTVVGKNIPQEAVAENRSQALVEVVARITPRF